MQIATFVFVDLEPTGLPKEELNKTKIVELSLVAVSRDHFLDTMQGATPRVQDKLTLCFNPQKAISSISTKVTGLENELLEHKTAFNADVCDLINNFLKLLPKPVCLIAQNGMNFDFPIIKRHFNKFNMSLATDVMCADCYHAFYDISELKKKVEEEILNSKVEIENESSDKSNEGWMLNEENQKHDTDSAPILESSKMHEKSHKIGTPQQKPFITDIENEILLQEDVALEFTKDFTEIEAEELRRERIKLSNETTPKRPVRQLQPPRVSKPASRVDKVRRRFPFSIGNKPKESFRLKNIYQRIFNRPALNAHRAESDCIYALEIAVVYGKEFVSWIDKNCRFFSEIMPMTPGVPIDA